MTIDFARFFRSESSSGWLLLFCIGVSLLVANSTLAEPFARLLAQEVGYRSSGIHLRFSVQGWINDGLMAAFFLLVGLEVKRAFLIGELATFRKASVPVFAALGGCVVPAGLFALINMGRTTANGWAIPMATDIAFALAVLSIAAGRRAGSMRSFLSTLAIADDLCAVVVIAVFYSSGLHAGYLMASAAVFGVQVLMNKAGVKALWLYILLGCVLWYFVHHSGVHATIAGGAYGLFHSA